MPPHTDPTTGLQPALTLQRTTRRACHHPRLLATLFYRLVARLAPSVLVLPQRHPRVREIARMPLTRRVLQLPFWRLSV